MNIMKHLFTMTLVLLLTTTACAQDPNELLSNAKSKFTEDHMISFVQTAYYPDPMNNYTAFKEHFSLKKNKENPLNYDYISTDDTKDQIYLNGEYVEVKHKNSSVYRLNAGSVAAHADNAKGNLRWSPLNFIQYEDWVYVNDTTIEGKQFSDFSRVETDKIHEGNHVFTELHLLINPLNEQIERFERRNYFNGALNQKVYLTYEDYRYDASGELSYEFPKNYQSAIFGQDERRMISVGEKAPEFSAMDLEGNEWSLADYKGQKVLIDFSVINCGYCLEAIKYMNEEEITFPEDLEVVYISTEDNKDKLKQYDEQFNIPFRAIAEAEKIGEMYGVSGWPRFVLINEEGVIDDIIVGFDKEKIMALKAQ